MTDSEVRERIATLEADMRHIEKKLDSISQTVGEVHNLLMQARGAKYVVFGMATLAGTFAGFAAKFLPFKLGS